MCGRKIYNQIITFPEIIIEKKKNNNSMRLKTKALFVCQLSRLLHVFFNNLLTDASSDQQNILNFLVFLCKSTNKKKGKTFSVFF